MNSLLENPARILPKGALSLEAIRRAAPSVFAEHAKPGVSDRYSSVSTSSVVDLLEGEGWLPTRVREQKVRAENRIGFQMHEIRFARTSDLSGASFIVGQTRPELVLQNAHDGSRAYRIDAGLYRLVCSNGLTVSDSQFETVSIRHSNTEAAAFVAAAKSVADSTPRVLEVMERWSGTKLGIVSRLEFAKRAASLRWDADSPVLRTLHPERLLRPIRGGDLGEDLWTTFNVVQEHLVRGGDRYVGSNFQRGRTRAIAGIQEDQSLNKKLWSLASEFANN